MANTKTTKKSTNEQYLNIMFSMFKKRENVAVASKKGTFNDTELRLIGEILSAKLEGKRLISTQLAKLLGITRSAISQIVNRLEKEGIVKRVADDVDRKIAYIEVTETTMEQYEKEIKRSVDFAGKIVKTFGEEKFKTLHELFTEFTQLIETEGNKRRK